MRLRVLIFLTASVFAGTLCAKDLTSRLGIGYKENFSFAQPAIAAHYYPNSEFGFTAALGVDTDENNSRFGLQGGIRKIIFEERNLNFYMGGALAIVTVESAGVSQSGYEINALTGAEFFFSGLENLGFNFETGVGIVSLKSGTKFRTIGDSPFRAGLIFYF